MTTNYTTEIERAWVDRRLTKKAKKGDLLDAVTEIFDHLWDTDDHFFMLASSTSREDAVEGDRRSDEGEVARMIRDEAVTSGNYPIVVAATLGEIRIKAGGAARRGNVSRSQLAAKKAEYKALVANGQTTGEPWISHHGLVDPEQQAG